MLGEFIEEVKREQKRIVLWSEIMEEVEAVCDSVMMIESGGVI